MPSRRAEADAEVIVGSIAGSAGIWIVASVALATATWAVNSVGWFIGLSWHVDLWNWWLAPSLTTHDFGLHSIAPGIILTALAAVGGGVGSVAMKKHGRVLRVLEFGPFHYDPNPRVWGWFMATEKGAVFRVRLKSGKVVVGQVEAYSTNPNDEVLEIVMQEYSIAPDDQTELTPVEATEGILLLRDDIETIERLALKIEQPPS